MKKCNKCLSDKDDSEFYSQVQRGTIDQIWKYLDSYCKSCRIEYA